ncbi:endonuclease/exonuclease/phosphatase family protein [Lacipirellula sp.]|uniref:endonuclease/exonuclease/phosphatase family protein n=1 Tax=Lacipirellula sp. TaxID=2691419 RepID=UPI003D0BB212
MKLIVRCLFVLTAFGISHGTAVRAELPPEIRVVTYNIHHGAGTDGKLDLKRIATLINAEKPDLVGLNEVDQGCRRSQGIDEPAELARLTGMTHIFEKNIDHDSGIYGNAILSRLPIVRHENHKLPSDYKGEQRGALEVEVGDEDDSLLFICTHLDFRPNDHERMESIKTIEDLAAKRAGKPMILVGDLNATPESRVMQTFAQNWGRSNSEPAFTFPAANPNKQIDYIQFRPAAEWEVVETRVLDEPVASDHRGMMAVLRRKSSIK